MVMGYMNFAEALKNRQKKPLTFASGDQSTGLLKPATRTPTGDIKTSSVGGDFGLRVEDRKGSGRPGEINGVTDTYMSEEQRHQYDTQQAAKESADKNAAFANSLAGAKSMWGFLTDSYAAKDPAYRDMNPLTSGGYTGDFGIEKNPIPTAGVFGGFQPVEPTRNAPYNPYLTYFGSPEAYAAEIVRKKAAGESLGDPGAAAAFQRDYAHLFER